MAFFLTPRFTPAYTSQQCSPWSCAPAGSPYPYHRAAHPSFSSLAPFLSQVDELLGALDLEARREAQLEAHREAQRQRQLRKRAPRAHFVAHESNEGYQIDAEIPGFQQENVEIEIIDVHTLRVAGNTAKKADQHQHSEIHTAESLTANAVIDSMEGVTLNEPAPKQERPSSPTYSETGSSKSYQATVEDDFEDLGAETSSIISASSEASQPKESKGKRNVVEPATDKAVQQQPHPEAPSPSQQESDENAFNGTFERTFRFGERIDSTNVHASLKNGQLSITVPKAKAPEVRRILIQ